MKNARLVLLGSAVFVTLVGGAILMKGRAGGEKANESAHESSSSAQTESETAAVASIDRQPQSIAARASSGEKETTTGKSAPASSLSKVSVEIPRELMAYAEMNKKVFLTDDEKAQKKGFFRDSRFLKSLESLLRQPAEIGSDLQIQQFAALDALFEAVQSPDSERGAEDVLRSLVEDKSVEDPKLDGKSREALAGVKAEILYQWSSLQPNKAGEINRLLPGPVSQRIWQNVLDTQRNNVAESQEEARAQSKR
jgi:hypothetical protein